MLAIERIADQNYPNNILMVTHAYGVQEAFRLVQCDSDPYHFVSILLTLCLSLFIRGQTYLTNYSGTSLNGHFV